MKWKRTAMSLALAGCMMATTVPVTAFATNENTTVTTPADNQKKTVIAHKGKEWQADKFNADAVTLKADTTYVDKDDVPATVQVQAEVDITEFPESVRGEVCYWLEDDANLVKNATAKHSATAGTATVALTLDDAACKKVATQQTVKLTLGFLTDDDKVEYITKEYTLTVGAAKAVDTVEYNKDLAVRVGGQPRTVNLTWLAADKTTPTTIPEVTWSSTNAEVATVAGTNDSVTVTPAGMAGTATVKGSYFIGNVHHQITINVTSTNPNGSIQIEDTDNPSNAAGKSMYVGQTATLKVNFTNIDAETPITWTSSDPSVVSVEKYVRNTATIKANAAGKTVITAVAGGATITYDLTVMTSGKAASDVKLDKTEVTLRQGQRAEANDFVAMTADTAAHLKLVLDPVDADATVDVGDPILDGSDVNPSIISGISVTPIGDGNKFLYVGVGANVPVGTYTVTIPVNVRSADNRVVMFEKQLNFTLNVKAADASIVSNLELTAKNIKITANNNYALDDLVQTEVTPVSLEDQVKYTIKGTDVAELVGDVVKVKKAGGFTVQATVGDKTDSVNLSANAEHVATALHGFKLDNSSLVMKESTTADLKPMGLIGNDKVYSYIHPDNLVWSSSDASVAKVDGSGKVTALKTGTATITAQLGSYTAECKVVVGDVNTDPKPAIKFVDVADKAWYHDAVYEAANKGLMKGTGNDKFEPMGTVERSQVAQIVWNIAGAPAVTGAPAFTDVAANAWYAQPIKWASDQKIVNGIGGNKFGPSLAVTREDFVTMLYRYAKTPATTGDLSKFSDAGKVAPHAQDAMKWAVSTGLVNGDDKGQLNPKSTLSRAEAAAIVVRYAK